MASSTLWSPSAAEVIPVNYSRSNCQRAVVLQVADGVPLNDVLQLNDLWSKAGISDVGLIGLPQAPSATGEPDPAAAN